MNRNDIFERLIKELPPLHWATARTAEYLSEFYQKRFVEGPISHSVSIEVLQYFQQVVKPDDTTLETGGGQTTIALAALANHHTCISDDHKSIELIKAYMKKAGIPEHKVTFICQSSDLALPAFTPEQELDFAFVDGCHGYPYPALDWHYIDFHLKTGGIIGLDNIEIHAVNKHCEFLEKNDMYTLSTTVRSPGYGDEYGASFYIKQKHEPTFRNASRSRYPSNQIL